MADANNSFKAWDQWVTLLIFTGAFLVGNSALVQALTAFNKTLGVSAK
jgi:hypothetical protein